MGEVGGEEVERGGREEKEGWAVGGERGEAGRDQRRGSGARKAGWARGEGGHGGPWWKEGAEGRGN